jgi:hypothetical protein
LAAPPISYEVEVLEDDPARPFGLGGTVTLRDPARGIAATPRQIAERRVLRRIRGADPVIQQPILTLDNRPQSLIDNLVKAGSL